MALTCINAATGGKNIERIIFKIFIATSFIKTTGLGLHSCLLTYCLSLLTFVNCERSRVKCLVLARPVDGPGSALELGQNIAFSLAITSEMFLDIRFLMVLP